MNSTKLAAIDRELDALGKSAGELADVVARARAIGGAIDDLDAALESLGVALEGPRTALAPRVALDEAPAELRPPPEDDGDEPPTGLVVRVDRAPETEEPTTSDAPPEAPSEPPPGGDIAGLSVDDLFADAEPAGLPSGGAAGGLADLFQDDAEPRAGEQDVGSLEDMLEPGGAAERDELNPFAALDEGDDTLNPFAELEEEHTSVVPQPVLPQPVVAPPRGEPTGDFELLVDEDVLSVDDDELEPMDEPGPEDEGGEGGDKKRGLFSRLLGRK